MHKPVQTQHGCCGDALNAGHCDPGQIANSCGRDNGLGVYAGCTSCALGGDGSGQNRGVSYPPCVGGVDPAKHRQVSSLTGSSFGDHRSAYRVATFRRARPLLARIALRTRPAIGSKETAVSNIERDQRQLDFAIILCAATHAIYISFAAAACNCFAVTIG